MSETIIEEMRAYHARVQSWRVLGAILDKSAAHALQVCRGTRTLQPEDIERWQAFRDGRTVEYGQAPICPDCGQVHAVGRCGGRSGEPIFVTANMRVVVPKPRVYKRLRDMPTGMLARLIRERVDYA